MFAKSLFVLQLLIQVVYLIPASSNQNNGISDNVLQLNQSVIASPIEMITENKNKRVTRDTHLHVNEVHIHDERRQVVINKFECGAKQTVSETESGAVGVSNSKSVVGGAGALCLASATYEQEPADDWRMESVPPQLDLLDERLINATGCKHTVVPGGSLDVPFYNNIYTGSLHYYLAVRARLYFFIRIYVDEVYLYGILVRDDGVRTWRKGDADWSDFEFGLPHKLSARRYTPLQISQESGRVNVAFGCDRSRLKESLSIKTGSKIKLTIDTTDEYWKKLLYDCPA